MNRLLIYPCPVMIEAEPSGMSHAYTKCGYLFHFAGNHYQYQSVRLGNVLCEYCDYNSKKICQTTKACAYLETIVALLLVN